MKLNLKFVGIGLILIALIFVKIPNKEVPTIVIPDNKPEASYVSFTKDASDLIIDKTDRSQIAIVSDVFSKRVQTYENATGQNVNDVFVEACKNIFDGRLRGKYPGFSEKIKGIFLASVGEDDITLSGDKLKVAGNYFSGLTWNLKQ